MAVAELLHFGHAAESLSLPQPTVSRHIRELEEELGVTLLTRSSRASTLTPAGEAVLDHARTVLDRADRLRAAADAAARQTRGEVTVSFVPSTVTMFLAPLVQLLGERAPEVALRVTHAPLRELPASVRSGAIDLAITRTPPDRGGMVITPLLDEPVLAVLPEDHPLASRPRLARDELAHEPRIVLAPDVWPGGETAIRERLAAIGVEPRIAARVGSHQAAIAHVAAGTGVYQLPASAAIAHVGVRYVELEEGRSSVVLLRRTTPPTPAQQAVIDATVDAATAVATSQAA